LKKAKATARRLKLKLFIIGKVEKGEGKVFLLDRKTGKRVQLEDMGYVHLNRRGKSG
jgi:thiamine monophosphate kinase